MPDPPMLAPHEITSRDYTLLLGQFKDSEVESAFRQDRIERELKLFVFIAWFVVVAATLLVVQDLNLIATRSGVSTVFFFRLVWVASAIGILVAARTIQTPEKFYRVSTVFAIVTVVVVTLIDQSRPAAYMSHYAFDMLVVLAMYLAFPIPLGQRVIAGLVFSVGSIALLFIYKEPIHDFARGSITSCFVIANVIGFLAARWNEVSQRSTFDHIQSEHSIAQRLEEAVATASKLSVLLPICGQCKKVRDVDGYWHEIEIFFADRSPADFSHSLCADCIRELYPDRYSH